MALDTLISEIDGASRLITECLHSGAKVLWAGNGGSAADAQHMAAELVGRFVTERRGLPSIALTTDTSAMTAISNDYGFSEVFVRQIEALGNSGDVFVGISTSGSSPNIERALTVARERGLKTIGLTGRSGGSMPSLCDVCIVVPSQVTARIQECHILIGHILCQRVDEAFA